MKKFWKYFIPIVSTTCLAATIAPLAVSCSSNQNISELDRFAKLLNDNRNKTLYPNNEIDYFKEILKNNINRRWLLSSSLTNIDGDAIGSPPYMLEYYIVENNDVYLCYAQPNINLYKKMNKMDTIAHIKNYKGCEVFLYVFSDINVFFIRKV